MVGRLVTPYVSSQPSPSFPTSKRHASGVTGQPSQASPSALIGPMVIPCITSLWGDPQSSRRPSMGSHCCYPWGVPQWGATAAAHGESHRPGPSSLAAARQPHPVTLPLRQEGECQVSIALDGSLDGLAALDPGLSPQRHSLALPPKSLDGVPKSTPEVLRAHPA